jgi:hypothetical protein
MAKWMNVVNDKVISMSLIEFWDDFDEYWYDCYAELEFMCGTCCGAPDIDFVRYAFETFGAIRYASSSSEQHYETIADANILKVLAPCGLQSVLQLSGFHSLTALYITDCHVTDDLVVALSSLKFAHLHNLNLSYNDITSIGACALAEMFMDNSTLRSLELNRNFIGDEGGAALARLIANNTQLQTLVLCDNRFSKDIAALFQMALRSNFNLVLFKSAPVFRCNLSYRRDDTLRLGVFLMCGQRQQLRLYTVLWEQVLQILFDSMQLVFDSHHYGRH